MADKNPVIIIQARLGSTRLPGKVLKQAAGRPLLAWLLARLTHAGLPTVLAVPREEQGHFTDLAAEFPIQIFGGDGEDVLDRYTEAARANNADPIIRVTGDNPLTSVTCLKLCLEKFELMGADLCHPVGLPYGAGVEVVGRQAIESAWKNAREPDEREHVTRWIYKNPGRFEIIPMEVPPDHMAPDLRVTVDTDVDFARFDAIARLVKPRRYIRLVDAIAFLQKQGTAAENAPTSKRVVPDISVAHVHSPVETEIPAKTKIVLPTPTPRAMTTEDSVSISAPKVIAPPPKPAVAESMPSPAPTPPVPVPKKPAPAEAEASHPIPPPPEPVHPEGVNLQEGGFSAVRRAAAAFLANLGRGDASEKAPAPAAPPTDGSHGFAPIPEPVEAEPKPPRKKTTASPGKKPAKKAAKKTPKTKSPKKNGD